MTDDNPATQAERRAMLKQDAAARTYFEMAQGEGDDGRTPVVGAAPFGSKLPAPAWAHDPTGPEPPLGIDVNEVPIIDVPAAMKAEAAAMEAQQTERSTDDAEEA